MLCVEILENSHSTLKIKDSEIIFKLERYLKYLARGG